MPFVQHNSAFCPQQLLICKRGYMRKKLSPGTYYSNAVLKRLSSDEIIIRK